MLVYNETMNLTRAYAYIRFSSSKQREGDSLRRQLESCLNYCSQNSLILDEREFRDFGKSAYKKANIKKGSALSAFLALVESEEIPKGSYLLIESIDRLSRADIYSALMLFGSIINNGIKIVEISKNQIYTSETLTQLGPMLAIMADTLRAHDESRIKGIRSRANWQRRKDNSKTFATPITRECPRWLRVSTDGSGYEVLKDKVDSIRQVFEMRKMGLGASAIANRCNEQKLTVPGKGGVWHTSLINRLIKNRALIGEYQPHITNDEGVRVPDGEPLKAFYPRVIDVGLFETVQQINFKSKEFPKKRSSSNRNFLNGIIFCSCGAPLHRKLKSTWELDISRYYCSQTLLKAASCKSVDCKSIEDTMMYFMSERAPGLITFDNFSDKLRMEEASHRSQVLEIETQMERLMNVIQHGAEEDLPQVLLTRLKDLERKKEMHTKIADRMLAETKDSSVYWGIKADDIFLKAIRSGDSEKLSLLRFQISRLVKRVTYMSDINSLLITLNNSHNEIVPITQYFDSDFGESFN